MHKITKTALFCHFILISCSVQFENMSDSADQWASMIINELFPRNETQNEDLEGAIRIDGDESENENLEPSISLLESDLNPSNETGDYFNDSSNPNENYSAPELTVSSATTKFDSKCFDNIQKCSFDFAYSANENGDPSLHLECTNLYKGLNSSVDVSARNVTTETCEDAMENETFDFRYGNITKKFLDKDIESCDDSTSGIKTKQFEDKMLFDMDELSSDQSRNNSQVDSIGAFKHALANAGTVNMAPGSRLSYFGKKELYRDSDLNGLSFEQFREEAHWKEDEAAASLFNRSKSENFKEFSFHLDSRHAMPGPNRNKISRKTAGGKNRFKSKSAEFSFDSKDPESDIEILRRIDEKLQDLKNCFSEEDHPEFRENLGSIFYEQFADAFIQEERRWSSARHERVQEEDTFKHVPTGSTYSRTSKDFKYFDADDNRLTDRYEGLFEEEFKAEDSPNNASYECMHYRENRKHESLKRKLARRHSKAASRNLSSPLIEKKSKIYVKTSEKNCNNHTRSSKSLNDCYLESHGINESKKIGPLIEQRNAIPFKHSSTENQCPVSSRREHDEDYMDDDEDIKSERVRMIVSVYRDVCKIVELLFIKPFARICVEFVDFFVFITFLSLYMIYKLFCKVKEQSGKYLSRFKKARSSSVKTSTTSSIKKSHHKSCRINKSNKIEDSMKIFEDITSWSYIEPKDVLLLKYEKGNQNFDFLYDKGERYLEVMKRKHSSVEITAHEDALVDITQERNTNIVGGSMSNVSNLHMTVIASSERPQSKHLTIFNSKMFSEWDDTPISVFATDTIHPDSMLFETAQVGEWGVLNSTEVDDFDNTGSSSRFKLFSTSDRSDSENVSEVGIRSETSLGRGTQDSLSVNLPSFTSRSNTGDFSSLHSTESFSERIRDSGDFSDKQEKHSVISIPWSIEIPSHLVREPLFSEKNQEGSQVYLEAKTKDIFLKCRENENIHGYMHEANFGQKLFENNTALQFPQDTEEKLRAKLLLQQYTSKSLDGGFRPEMLNSDVPLIPVSGSSQEQTSSEAELQQDSSGHSLEFPAGNSDSSADFGAMGERQETSAHPKRKRSLRRRMSLILDNWKSIQVMPCMSVKRERKRKYKKYREDSET